MKLIPVITEKSTKLSKSGGFTFWLPSNLTKPEIVDLINKTFNVHVVKVRTINYKSATKKNLRGKVQKIKGGKKAIVFLKDKEKIDLFEEEKKVKKVKKTKKEAK